MLLILYTNGGKKSDILQMQHGAMCNLMVPALATLYLKSCAQYWKLVQNLKVFYVFAKTGL